MSLSSSSGAASTRLSLNARLSIGLGVVAALLVALAVTGVTALRSNTADVRQLLGKAAAEASGNASLTQLSAQVQASSEFHVGLIVVLTLAGLVALVLSGVMLVRSLRQQIQRTIDSAQRIASGDLTHDIPIDQHDDLGDLQKAVAQMQDRLRQVVGNLRDTTNSISTASTQIASGNADLSQRTEQTAGSLQQTASSMEQLSGTVRTTADSARTANDLVQSAVEAAQRGGEVVSQVVSNMEDISASSRKIGEIIGVIDGIAFQTNILALNAAVEAARAGEQGRGFAVVAGEVRSLAQRAASAAKEIKTLINASVEKVESGGKLVRDAGSTMDAIVTSVQRVTQIIGEISTATGEQSAGLTHVSESVTQLDQMTQQNAALVHESASAAESLRQQAERLQKVVGAFRLLQQTQEAAWTAHTTISNVRDKARDTLSAPMPFDPPIRPAPPPSGRTSLAQRKPPERPSGDDGWETF